MAKNIIESIKGDPGSMRADMNKFVSKKSDPIVSRAAAPKTSGSV